MILELVHNLCSVKKLDRDNAVLDVQKFLSTCQINGRLLIESELLKILSNSQVSWESKQGCLLGVKSLIPFLDLENDTEIEFTQKIEKISIALLTDVEVRVRIEAGEVLGALCAMVGTGVYCEEKDYILQLVRSNLERQTGNDEASKMERLETEKLMEKLAGSSQRRGSAEADQIFHDTAGWKNLETSLKCVQAMVYGCGTNFQPFVDDELLSLLFLTLTHTNRFVRETGFYVCSALVSCANTSQDLELRDSVSVVNPIYAYGHEISVHLAKGLADNWSQVRLAASDATRNFLLSLPDDRARELFYPELLPKMCLNRYYIAEGVRNYSQETWRRVLGSRGRELVRSNIDTTVSYYREATRSDNHAVREAACACIAELVGKIDPSAVKPHVPILLQTLLECFGDDSWPVRDAACVACGHFVSCFPEESFPILDQLYQLFFNNLGDSIPSVRQGAAIALGNVVRAYGSPALDVVLTRIRGDLTNMMQQPAEFHSSASQPAQFGVVKRARDNDMQLHSDQQMYSCGSLAPKMGRGGADCGDNKYRREPQLWEKGDGSVYLLAELATTSEGRQSVLQMLPHVAEACQHRHYTHYVVFLETVCKQLPILATNIGVKLFKSILSDFIEPIFHALECENALTSSAASQCLNQISILVGQNILRARIANIDSRYLQKFDANIYIAPL